MKAARAVSTARSESAHQYAVIVCKKTVNDQPLIQNRVGKFENCLFQLLNMVTWQVNTELVNKDLRYGISKLAGGSADTAILPVQGSRAKYAEWLPPRLVFQHDESISIAIWHIVSQ